MADATDPQIPQTEAEKAYQANLVAARERLAAIEAAMGAPKPFEAAPVPAEIPPLPVQAPTPAPAPVPAPQPVTPVQPTGFSLSSLKNPATVTPVPAPIASAPTPEPVPVPTPQPVAPTPPPVPVPAPAAPPVDIAAMIAAHKSVSPLAAEKAIPAATPIPAPAPEANRLNPLQRPQEPAKTPDHLKPVKTPPQPRSMPSRLKPLLSAIIVFFIVLAAFKAPIFYYQLKYLFNNQSSTQTSNIASNEVATTPTLTIPKINVSAPIVFEPSIAEANVQKALESGVIHYGNTANPGENGNAVIFGHSSNDWDKPGGYKFIFVLLEKLAVGDTYSIDYKGTRYEYQIYERKVILATDVGVVAPTAEPTSTLITCWPTGTSQKRLIVRGKQISPEPTSNGNVAADPSKLNTVGSSLPGTDSNNGVTGTITTWIENIRSAIKGEPIQVNDK